ncbi:ornithine cyclodeaminase [Micromonospora sicca]|uniref:Ornithine cyclodeaminase n=2 Tax=Micromonosporaceae TaxID=28056 RepID=A0A317DNJ8_9ACTN|nr:ornithine cyclodeaminase family protein [Micromonospora sp. ATA51]PWR15396.1 ornithine cyclodeaminase [Micromonospora sp. 4G51]
MIDATAIRRALPMAAAIDVIVAALVAGLDPDQAAARSISDFTAGQVLSMPAEVGGRVGVKLATAAPGNPRIGLPRIQAVYVLMDGATLTPIALLDGTELTNLRTPAVSAVAVDRLAVPQANHLVLFGTGPQAWGHVEAVRAVRPISRVSVVGRDGHRTRAFVERLRGLGLDAAPGTAAAVAGADVIACCTTAREPLFDGRLLADHAVVVACGSHEPTAREVDTETVRRSVVVVESVASACAEAGDVIMAMAEGAVARTGLVGLAALVGGETATAGPSLFKSVGMAWEDLVVASAVFDTSASHVRPQEGAS